jgi:hypothetical protein
VNLLIPSGGWPALLDPLYLFLPLALAAFVTFVLLSVQWLAQLFADRHEGSK